MKLNHDNVVQQSIVSAADGFQRLRDALLTALQHRPAPNQK